jgi:hypothetical protein
LPILKAPITPCMYMVFAGNAAKSEIQ